MADLQGHDDRDRSLGSYFSRAMKRARDRRPFSVYLIFAMLAVVLLGVQVVFVRDDPKRFALFLSLNFIFFFVVMYRAIIDAFEIFRKHFRERENLYQETIGEDSFVSELGRRASEEEQRKAGGDA